jgi:integrase
MNEIFHKADGMASHVLPNPALYLRPLPVRPPPVGTIPTSSQTYSPFPKRTGRSETRSYHAASQIFRHFLLPKPLPPPHFHSMGPGVTLHSYRYAWAERAKTAGYQERFAQEALGHNSKAVHRAYAKRALMKIPSLEDYEQRAAAKTEPAT